MGVVLVCALGCQSGGRDVVDRFVVDEMARQGIPGASVAIVRDGAVVEVAGYGMANVEHAVPARADTIFQSGSIGKQFTAAAVMLAVEDGAVALDDPITRYFPEGPESWRAITVRHLLTHTSGIPDYTTPTFDYRRDYTYDELVRHASALALEFPPGARWNYSNTGYLLLGILVERATGRFYGDILRDRVFGPLGMETARVISEADIVPNRAAGYRRVDDELKNQEWVAPQLNRMADGCLYLSVLDFVAWNEGLRRGAILSPESWQVVYTPVRLNSGNSFPYGFGWFVEEVDRVVVSLFDRAPTTESYTLVEGSVGYRFIGKRVVHQFLLRGSNLTNEEARRNSSRIRSVTWRPDSGDVAA